MNNIILLFVCFVLGVFFNRSNKMPQNLPASLNSFIINISLPCLTLLHIHELHFSPEIICIALMPWLHFGLALVFFLTVVPRLHLTKTWSRDTVGALILTAGLGNTSFFGLPMIEAFWGTKGIAYGIIVDQLGSFFALSTGGILVAAFYSGSSVAPRDILRRIITFPPFISLLIALALMPVSYPDWFLVILKRLGDTLVPLALFSVGFQFRPGHLGTLKTPLLLGLSFKLVIAPLFLAIVYLTMSEKTLPIQVTIFEAAMPPMITAGIIATERNLNPPLANLMVAFGLLVSFITLPLWWLFLR